LQRFRGSEVFLHPLQWVSRIFRPQGFWIEFKANETLIFRTLFVFAVDCHFPLARKKLISRDGKTDRDSNALDLGFRYDYL
jgi:hypothetical protein